MTTVRLGLALAQRFGGRHRMGRGHLVLAAITAALLINVGRPATRSV